MKNRAVSTAAPRLRLAVLALALSLCVEASWAQQGRRGPEGPVVRATAPLVEAGKPTDVAGSGFKPGQKVDLSVAGKTLNDTAFVTDAEGAFKGAIQVPADAALGTLVVQVVADGGAPITTEIKISRQLPLSGQERFTLVGDKLVQGLYQSAYSARNDAVFVTSAVGRPPVRQSELLKLDAKTLKVVAKATPAAAPPRPPREGAPAAPAGESDPGVYAVYGVGVDDVNNTVWVTNTRQDTVAVYRQNDLALAKQFPVGAVPHARDAVVDAKRGRAYVSATGEDFIAVFDTRSLEQLAPIRIASSKAGERFVPASLELDAAAGKLYTVGLRTSEAAIVDLASGKVDKVIPLDGAKGAIGVAWDAAGKRLLVVSQGSDNLLIVDPATGKTLHDVYVGAGALNVAYDPIGKLAYVSNRAAGTVTVVDTAKGAIVANLDGGTLPNHVVADGKGNVYAVNKSRGTDDPKGDRITRITAKAP